MDESLKALLGTIDPGRIELDDDLLRIKALTYEEAMQLYNIKHADYQVERIGIAGNNFDLLSPAEYEKAIKGHDEEYLYKNHNYNVVWSASDLELGGYSSQREDVPQWFRDFVAAYQAKFDGQSEYTRTSLAEPVNSRSAKSPRPGASSAAGNTMPPAHTSVHVGKVDAPDESISGPADRLVATPSVRAPIAKLNSLLDRKQHENERHLKEVSIDACDAMLDDKRILDPTRSKLLLLREALISKSDRKRSALAKEAGVTRFSNKEPLFVGLAAEVCALAFASYELQLRKSPRVDERFLLFMDAKPPRGFVTTVLQYVVGATLISGLWLVFALTVSIPSTVHQFVLLFVQTLELVMTSMIVVTQVFLSILILFSFYPRFKSPLLSSANARTLVLGVLSVFAMAFTMALAGQIVPSVIDGRMMTNPFLGPKIDVDDFNDVRTFIWKGLWNDFWMNPLAMGTFGDQHIASSNNVFSLIYRIFHVNITLLLLPVGYKIIDKIIGAVITQIRRA